MGLLDNDGLSYLWGIVKDRLSGKVDKVTGKGLSTNDYTTDEKTKLAGIDAGANAYKHPSHTAKASGLYKVTVDNLGHVSATEAVSKNDITALGIPGSNTTYDPATASANGLMSSTDKAKLDGFSSASSYALKSEVSSAVKYKGSKATVADLPSTGNTVGDMWNVTATDMNYIWTGSVWDPCGTTFTITPITNAEIDAIVAK